MSKGKQYLVVTYYAYNDPLFQGLLWSIVSELKQPNDQITLVSLEHNAIDQDLQKTLLDQGITWKPVSFAYGDAVRLKKVAMMLRIQLVLFVSAIFKRPYRILSSGSLAASLCWPITAFFGLTQVVYAFEPHSEFLLDQKKCSEHSLAYQTLRFFEKRVMKGRSIIMTGTRAMRDRILQENARAHVQLLPTNADEKLFQFSAENRMIVRERLGVKNRRVITYVGKFGDLYLAEELIVFFAEMWKCDSSLFFQILTPHSPSEIAGWFKKNGIIPSNFWIGKCPLNELPNYLSAADFGVVAYADLPSRKYTSPTKSGNYLLCGLPYIIQSNTSDDDIVVSEHRVGIVIDRFDKEAARHVVSQLSAFWAESPEQLRDRCREAGIEYRGMQNARAVYQKFF